MEDSSRGWIVISVLAGIVAIVIFVVAAVAVGNNNPGVAAVAPPPQPTSGQRVDPDLLNSVQQAEARRAADGPSRPVPSSVPSAVASDSSAGTGGFTGSTIPPTTAAGQPGTTGSTTSGTGPAGAPASGAPANPYTIGR